jgi:FkbM family methyltransferase
MPNIIYDIGASNGQNIAYYLLKADKVVAVEADFRVCNLIREKFPDEIKSGRLAVENCAATHLATSETVIFHFHRKHSVLNQLPEPAPGDNPMLAPDMYQKAAVQSRPLHEIIEQHGHPFYIKLDVENYDAYLIKALFDKKIYPRLISAEAHHRETVEAIFEHSDYQKFKVVDGPTVSRVYGNALIQPAGSASKVRYSFPAASAGPCGDDIIGPWLNKQGLLTELERVGFGWKDVHARLTLGRG